MYLISVILLLLILPLASVGIDAVLHPGAAVAPLVGKWLVFWAVGARLFVAGVRQVVQPQFTAGTIFGIKDRGADVIVREVGFANLAMGAAGLISLSWPAFLLPAALTGAAYYGLAGLGHVFRGERNSHERVAMVSDLLICAALAAIIVGRAA
jgi:hypothetical protein